MRSNMSLIELAQSEFGDVNAFCFLRMLLPPGRKLARQGRFGVKRIARSMSYSHMVVRCMPGFPLGHCECVEQMLSP